MASMKQGFSFKDVGNNMKRLVSLHKAQKKYIKFREQEAEKKGLIRPILSAFNLKKAMRTLARKTARYYGQTSIWQKPHQNDRECARRLRVGSAAYHSAASALENDPRS